MIIEKMFPAIACSFTWIGFVGAISFMESWMKFRAPGISIPLGLGIGRIVFSALNKVEWTMAFIILLNILMAKSGRSPFAIYFLIPVLLLLLQTIWLLPALDLRAQLQIDGASIPPSNLHWYYVGMEVIKTGCLFLFGISLLSFAASA